MFNMHHIHHDKATRGGYIVLPITQFILLVPQFLSKTEHFGKIRLHMPYTLLLIYSLRKFFMESFLNYNF